MLLIKSSDDVDAICLHHHWLIQCPKTKIIHVIERKAYGLDKSYYMAVQNSGACYITNDSIQCNADGDRYYFTNEKLKELINTQRFTIMGFL